MSQLFREAVRDAQDQYDTLLMHLSLIRDLTRLGQHAPSFAVLATQLAESLVTGLGHERVVVIAGRDPDSLMVAGSYSQSERFGDPAAPMPAVLLSLAREVMREGALLRWGGDGVGQRLPLPAGIEGSVIGFFE